MVREFKLVCRRSDAEEDDVQVSAIWRVIVAVTKLLPSPVLDDSNRAPRVLNDVHRAEQAKQLFFDGHHWPTYHETLNLCSIDQLIEKSVSYWTGQYIDIVYDTHLWHLKWFNGFQVTWIRLSLMNSELIHFWKSFRIKVETWKRCKQHALNGDQALGAFEKAAWSNQSLPRLEQSAMLTTLFE